MKKLSYEQILTDRITLETAKSVKRFEIFLMLSNIRSLYNVGSIFRTADSALVKKIILCGFTPFPPRPEIDKTALGATQTVPWEYFKRTEDAITELKSKGIKVFAVELTDRKRLYTSLTPEDFPICLVLGNEISGLEDSVVSLCDDSIEIPMYGVKHSLNVSVAAGIVTYAAVEAYNNFFESEKE